MGVNLNMDYHFGVGQKYRRRDVYRIIGIPEDTHGGNWDTGYARLGDDWFIFCNIGIPGRTGHDYANRWLGDRLEWYGKTGSCLAHRSIQSMIGPRGETYVFYRESNDEPFTFAGKGQADAVEDTTPVKITWAFSAG